MWDDGGIAHSLVWPPALVPPSLSSLSTARPPTPSFLLSSPLGMTVRPPSDRATERPRKGTLRAAPSPLTISFSPSLITIQRD